jgi:hypothetical protein
MIHLDPKSRQSELRTLLSFEIYALMAHNHRLPGGNPILGQNGLGEE